jgi:predicted NBD/HSP70 family sugar kinase
VKEEKVVAIGIAIPGPFFRNRDSREEGFEFQDWPEIPIERLLKERFGVYVFVEHDANAGALGSYWQMNVGQEKMLVYFSAGQGIGAGFVNGGKLILGALGVAGEIGHMTVETNGILCKCGNYGCLEMYCSSTVLVNRVNKKLTKGNYSILKEGSDLIRLGKPPGREIN